MARQALQKDQIVKLIVGAGQASPSPPVGPALGSKGVKSMDFCKEFNARTANYLPGTPIPTRVTVRPDRSFHFETRTPTTSWLLFRAAGDSIAGGSGAQQEPAATGGGGSGGRKGDRLRGSSRPGHDVAGRVSLKHIYDIARIKHSEVRLSGMTLEALCRCVVASARSAGIEVVP